MFERFTDRARRVVVLAQEEARMLSHNYIGTEHLLLGLIHEGQGVAAQSLAALGISLDDVRSRVKEIIGKGQQAPTGHIPFTPRTKKVLELSLREALQLGHNYIGTEHILLALVREGEGVAAQTLVRMGAELTRIRKEVVTMLANYQGTPTPQERVAAAREALTRAQENVVAKHADFIDAVQKMMQPPAGDPRLTIRHGFVPGVSPPARGCVFVRCQDKTTNELFWLKVDVHGHSCRTRDVAVETDYPIVYKPEDS
jgi:ATP-dependent Clp protease ATP-binding subunit ClpA